MLGWKLTWMWYEFIVINPSVVQCINRRKRTDCLRAGLCAMEKIPVDKKDWEDEDQNGFVSETASQRRGGGGGVKAICIGSALIINHRVLRECEDFFLWTCFSFNLRLFYALAPRYKKIGHLSGYIWTRMTTHTHTLFALIVEIYSIVHFLRCECVCACVINAQTAFIYNLWIIN